VGLGVLTVIIRNFAAFPEGVTFSIILMNAIAPIIDSMTEKPVKLETVEVSS
jgi:Na+-translocating ferredoxin:NAD+ oxidoreductase RnfD subunit